MTSAFTTSKYSNSNVYTTTKFPGGILENEIHELNNNLINISLSVTSVSQKILQLEITLNNDIDNVKQQIQSLSNCSGYQLDNTLVLNNVTGRYVSSNNVLEYYFGNISGYPIPVGCVCYLVNYTPFLNLPDFVSTTDNLYINITIIWFTTTGFAFFETLVNYTKYVEKVRFPRNIYFEN